MMNNQQSKPTKLYWLVIFLTLLVIGLLALVVYQKHNYDLIKSDNYDLKIENVNLKDKVTYLSELNQLLEETVNEQ